MFFEVMRIALASLRSNKLRSVLTMLGIVIGVGAVIAMIALGNGAQQSVKDRIAKLGTTLLMVNPQRVQQGGVRQNVMAKLTMDDVQAIADRSPHVIALQPQQDRNFQVTWLNKNTNVQITGTTANYLVVRKFDIDRGTMFTDADNYAHRRVAVLGAGVLPLLGIVDPDAIVGENVRIGGTMFTVIGVLKMKGGGQGMGNPDEQVIVPFNTGRFRLFGNDRLNDIMALASADSTVPDAMAEIQSALRRAHRIPQGRPDDFSIRNQSDFLTTMGETTEVFTMLLAGIAAVSLLVGGIGIMNIMLVSVTERTREIGIRKALGATRRNILLQFLAEAVVMCLLGGILGVVAGAGGATVLKSSFGWSAQIDTQSIVLSFFFAAGVGVLFGVWPARRASGLDPIVALRYE